MDRRRRREQLTMYARVLLAAMALPRCASPDGVAVGLPDGGPGIGFFDDLCCSATLHRVLGPAGRAATIAFVAPGVGGTARHLAYPPVVTASGEETLEKAAFLYDALSATLAVHGGQA
jgi:hypothetical protein